jgi:hypothetical protein
MRERGYGSEHVIALAILGLVLGCATAAISSEKAEPAPLKQIADVPLPGPAVRFDYQSLDASHGRLYLSHMNADQLVVFDTKKSEVVANLDGFPNVHGVWAVPDLGRVYASVTGEHKVAVVDMQTLKIIAKTGPVKYPDGIAYAPGSKRIFVSDEHGNADVVFMRRPTRLLLQSTWAAVRATPFMMQAPATSLLPCTRRTNSWPLTQ